MLRLYQDPTNSQSLNRYTYVGNNPLSCTDPSGYFLKKIFNAIGSFFKPVFNAIKSLLSNPRALLSIAVGAGLFWAALPAIGITGVTAAGISGGVAGYIATGTLKGALIGAGTAMAFAGVHGLKEAWGVNPDTLGGQLASAGMHGAVGCASAAAGGGKCGAGFLSASVANFAGPKISPVFGDTYHGQLLAHATVGGIAAELGGGKFANGFVTAAFGYMFNDALNSAADGRSYKKDAANYHRYRTVTIICHLSEPGCTVDRVYEGVTKYPAPNSGGNPVSTGDRTSVFVLGTVEHHVSEDDLTVYNVTIENEHFLDPGYVMRRVVVQPKVGISVVSYGEGTGTSGGLNSFLAPILWPYVDRNIRNFVQEKK